ncbi:MAG TPA: GAF domain-containing protein [Sphingomicrobium sp.]|nr:GAF domain-containing protein [Sphingomicrobium sp.]
MEEIEEMEAKVVGAEAPTSSCIQPAGFLLELSPDWLILRASENAHSFLSEYHQRLIGEPLAQFTLAQPLHDLRNSLARQRGSSGIARAYRVRLIDEPRHFDIAFQSAGDSILLEGLPSPEEGFGDCLGAVSRLIEGLAGDERKPMLDGAARRMRALTGYDRVILCLGEERIESSRSPLAELRVSGDLPAIVAESSDEPVGMFPRKDQAPVEKALLRSPTFEQCEELRKAGIRSALRVPIIRDGEEVGYFQCDNRAYRPPSFELHAAAELFAQIFALLVPA